MLLEHAPSLLRSRHSGATQKIDVLGELSAPGPALHLCIVAVSATAAVLLRVPGFGWLALLLLASLMRSVLYTLLALARDREPLRALGAFVLLPCYAVWRLWVAVTSLSTLTSRIWVRTHRHRSAAAR